MPLKKAAFEQNPPVIDLEQKQGTSHILRGAPKSKLHKKFLYAVAEPSLVQVGKTAFDLLIIIHAIIHRNRAIDCMTFSESADNEIEDADKSGITRIKKKKTPANAVITGHR